MIIALAACLSLPSPAVVGAQADEARARVAQARIARVETAAATLERVRVRLDWTDGAASGELQLWAAEVAAPGLGYRYRDLHWRCPLQRIADGGWRCEGPLRSGRHAPMQLMVQFDVANTRAILAQGGARISLDRTAAAPDLTRIDLARVPLAWAQSLLARAWPEARFTAGDVDADLAIEAPANAPLRVSGPLVVRGLGLETADAGIAGENLGGRLRLDYRAGGGRAGIDVEGVLQGGEFLAGNTYLALPASPVGIAVHARQGDGGGWLLPRLAWRDGGVLDASGRATLAADGSLRSLDVEARAGDLAPWRERYLSGWLGLLGLGEVGLEGAMDLRAHVREGQLHGFDANLHGVDLRDPGERFVFDRLQGGLRYSAGDARVDSELRWEGGKLYGLEFGQARLPFASSGGLLRMRGDAMVPIMGGHMRVRDLAIRPPRDGAGTDIRFGLVLDDIDFGRVSTALGMPAFQGRLSGSIPDARYADERIEFDGGLSMQLFDGRVEFSALSLERPFGTAPSLSADIAFDGLDLMRLTEVLGFGSISGRLDGRIRGLRLVDWMPVAFDARFVTDAAPGVRQRISQRAVQNISSVGDASFVASLQGRLIGLFDDFGYRRIGIGCRLANEVCSMSGLHSAGNAFTIVEGAGLPRLTVVGFNRQVDWPTLVERLVAVGSGDVSPVVE